MHVSQLNAKYKSFIDRQSEFSLANSRIGKSFGILVLEAVINVAEKDSLILFKKIEWYTVQYALCVFL